MNNLYIMIMCKEMYEAVKRLHEEGVINNCVVMECNDTSYYEEHSWMYRVNPSICEQDIYEEIIDINSLPPIDSELMLKMYTYLPDAVSMGMRIHCFPVTVYEEEERKIMRHTRFWSYIFKKYEINYFVFTSALPHIQSWYIQYAIARINNCKMLLSASTDIGNIEFLGTEMENIGEDIGRYYRSILNEDINISLPKDLDDYLSRKKYKPMTQDELRKLKKKRKKECNYFVVGRYIGFMKYLQIPRMRVRYLGFLYKHGFHQWRKTMLNKNLNTERIYIPLIRAFERNWMCNQKQYNKLAEKPVQGEKYILFLLQYTPEETTCPRAGVFSNQMLSISILSYVAEKYGLKVYVKEHPAQYCRNKQFFKEVQSISNVRLIQSYEYNLELIKNAFAVSTQTGTVIIEAAVNNVPAICFGHGSVFKGLYGVYEVTSQSECDKAISTILRENECLKNDMRKYLFAIDQLAVRQTSKGKIENEDFWHRELSKLMTVS